jgi:hypothetical protein
MNATTVVGWHQRTGPLPDLRRRHQLERWERPRWVDHPYRLRLPDGRWRYVAEPYDLGPAALADLAWLAGTGWRVSVTAWQATHAPGETVAVTIEEAPR